MSVLTWLGNYIKLPLKFAGNFVIGQNIAGDVFNSRLQVTLLGGVANHNRVVNYDWWRRGCDVTGLQWDALIGIVGMAKIGKHVHDASCREAVYGHLSTEAFKWGAGFGI